MHAAALDTHTQRWVREGYPDPEFAALHAILMHVRSRPAAADASIASHPSSPASAAALAAVIAAITRVGVPQQAQQTTSASHATDTAFYGAQITLDASQGIFADDSRTPVTGVGVVPYAAPSSSTIGGGAFTASSVPFSAPVANTSAGGTLRLSLIHI